MTHPRIGSQFDIYYNECIVCVSPRLDFLPLCKQLTLELIFFTSSLISLRPLMTSQLVY